MRRGCRAGGGVFFEDRFGGGILLRVRRGFRAGFRLKRGKPFGDFLLFLVGRFQPIQPCGEVVFLFFFLFGRRRFFDGRVQFFFCFFGFLFRGFASAAQPCGERAFQFCRILFYRLLSGKDGLVRRRGERRAAFFANRRAFGIGVSAVGAENFAHLFAPIRSIYAEEDSQSGEQCPQTDADENAPRAAHCEEIDNHWTHDISHHGNFEERHRRAA